MRLAIFGLSVISSWGNGHATFWRALGRALARRGHRVAFFERDQWFYRAHRDLDNLPDHVLHVYPGWDAIWHTAREAARAADAAIVTSYCADARAAAALVLDECRGARIFYDMDTPVTLDRLERGEHVEYLPEHGLGAFDLVLSYAGGPSLPALQHLAGARATRPLYGCVDPDDYPVHTNAAAYALTYLGTYAADRESVFRELLLAPARARPVDRFRVGGPQYPDVDAWPSNVHYQWHVGQPEHLAFYGSGRFTLNLTRGAMARWGFCPSGRLFEAAACGTPLITDDWRGLDAFFEPDREVIRVRDCRDVVVALAMDRASVRLMASRARDRVLETCSADVRARELEQAIACVSAADNRSAGRAARES